MSTPVETANVTRTRLVWMDLLRGSAMLLLILYHASAIVALYGQVLPRWLVVFNEIFLPFRMPTLMFLSGMLLAGSLRKPLKPYYWGKFKFVVWPYIIWTVVHSFTYGLPWPLYNPKAWIATGYLWFLFYLGVFYALAPLLRRVPPLLIVVVSWAISVPLETPVEKRFFFLAGFFFLGHFCQSQGAKFERLINSWIVLALFPLAIGFSLYSAIYGPFRYQGSLAIFSVLGILVFARLAMKFQNQHWTRPIRYIGRNSIIFYTTHFPIIIVVISLSMLIFGAPLWAVVPLDFAVALLGGLSFAYLAARGPVKYLFQAPDPFDKFLARS